MKNQCIPIILTKNSPSFPKQPLKLTDKPLIKLGAPDLKVVSKFKKFEVHIGSMPFSYYLNSGQKCIHIFFVNNLFVALDLIENLETDVNDIFGREQDALNTIQRVFNR